MMQAAANLAYIAYTDDILDAPILADFHKMLVAVPAGAENGPWTLAWGPAAHGGVLLYAARGADGSLAVAFRGTNPANLWNGLIDFADDLNFLLKDWPFPPGNGMRVSCGIQKTLTATQEAVGPDIETGQRMTLLDFLARQPAGPLVVTGHSLGGALAVAATAWLQSATKGRFTLRPQTFAAQTAWNAPFAQWFQATFDYAAAVNANDVIPMMWADLPQFLATYTPAPKMHESARTIWDLFDAILGGEEFLRERFERITPTHELHFSLPVDPDSLWITQAGDMHAMKTAYFPAATGRTAPLLPNASG